MARALIAEDAAADRLLMGTILEEAGHELYYAVDGEEALGIYVRNRVDVVVTDIMMARKDGVELIMALRKLDPEAAIIAVSGEGPGGLDFAQLAGALRVMSKPIDQNTLLGAIQELTDGDEPTRPPTTLGRDTGPLL